MQLVRLAVGLGIGLTLVPLVGRRSRRRKCIESATFQLSGAALSRCCFGRTR